VDEILFGQSWQIDKLINDGLLEEAYTALYIVRDLWQTSNYAHHYTLAMARIDDAREKRWCIGVCPIGTPIPIVEELRKKLAVQYNTVLRWHDETGYFAHIPHNFDIGEIRKVINELINV